MRIEGIVISVDNHVAHVCVDNRMACSDCTHCPIKGVGRGVIEVDSMPSLEVGQRVFLRDKRSWFLRNKILSVVLGFCAGVAFAEILSGSVSLFPEQYLRGFDLLTGGVFAFAVVAILIVCERTRSTERGKGHKYDFEIVGKAAPANSERQRKE